MLNENRQGMRHPDVKAKLLLLFFLGGLGGLITGSTPENFVGNGIAMLLLGLFLGGISEPFRKFFRSISRPHPAEAEQVLDQFEREPAVDPYEQRYFAPPRMQHILNNGLIWVSLILVLALIDKIT